MSIVGRKQNILNGREIMELWVELGSLPRVAKHFQRQGKINPVTGRPFTASSFWRAAHLFIVNNMDEARDFYKNAGAIYTDDEWEMFILRKAIYLFRNERSTFLRWVIKHEWPKKYEAFYRDEFDINPEVDYDFFTQTKRTSVDGAWASGPRIIRRIEDSPDFPK